MTGDVEKICAVLAVVTAALSLLLTFVANDQVAFLVVLAAAGLVGALFLYGYTRWGSASWVEVVLVAAMLVSVGVLSCFFTSVLSGTRAGHGGLAGIDGVSIDAIYGPVLRCGHTFTGGAPQQGNDVYLMHRNVSVADSPFYINKAAWDFGAVNRWSVTINVGDDRSVGNKFVFYAFTVSDGDAGFLDSLAPYGTSITSDATKEVMSPPGGLEQLPPQREGPRDLNRGTC